MQFENELGEFFFRGFLDVYQSYLHGVIVKLETVLGGFRIFIVLAEIPHEFTGDFPRFVYIGGGNYIVMALNIALVFFRYFKPVILHWTS